ncbi:MAG: DUF350 domain-containing protein [Bacteroidetes bacterium]|nr:MAG: DUF350 domain-containing protein [Bacteroidota bacterium]TAG85786.1 MAG: DUF350 domain-containing protein [Bacteroidota bacterium]
MNLKLLFLAGTQLVLALLLAILVTFLSYRILRAFMVKKYNITEDNFAFALLCSSILFSVGYIISGTLQPAINVVRILSKEITKNSDLFFESIKYISLFVLLGFFVSFVVIMLGMYLFTLLTKNIDEFKEIGKDNKAVGLLVGVIIIVIALFVKDSTVLLLEAFIPYPKLYIP